MARSFSDRLGRCIAGGDLTISDLARWFDRPRATVNTWVNGRTPFGPSSRIAVLRLDLLELRVVRKIGFPVPAHLSWVEREKYIRGQRDDAERNTRVPDMRATG